MKAVEKQPSRRRPRRRGAIFAPFRRRLLLRFLDVALLRLRPFVVADDGIIANLSPLVLV